MPFLRTFLVYLCLSFSALALSPNVTVSDTITLPNGTNPSGTITISWPRALNDNQPTRQVIFPGSETIQVANGVIDVSLFPNGSMLPGGVCYSVVYRLAGYNAQRWWSIPTTTNPVNLQQIESSISCPAPYTAIIAPGQITPGPSSGTTVLTSSPSGFVSWQPSASGGSSLFSALIGGTNSSGQTMTVGSSSVINYSGSGVVDANQILNTAISSLTGNSGSLVQGTGPFTSGDLASFNSGLNVADSGIAAANVLQSTGSYSNPAWITSISGSKLSGAIPCASLPALSGDATNTNCAVTVTSTNGTPFAASATTNALNASNISSGTLAAARLPAINLAASGAGGVTGNLQSSAINGGAGCSATTWVRGDMSCQSIANGGTVTNSFGPLTAGQIVVGNGGNDETVLGSLGTLYMTLHANPTGNPTWSMVALGTDVSGVLPTPNGGTGTPYFAVSGPASTTKTFTFPNANATVLTTNAFVTLAQGGTGADFSGIALGGLLSGTGAGMMGITAAGTNGYVLSANSSQPGGLQWVPVTGTGTVTSITFNSPLTGGTVTATGTVGCATCVTSAAALTANQIVIGSGLQGTQTLGSLGTTTTYLQGNSGGAPTWTQVDLAGGVTGTLAAASGGTGVANTATLTLGTSNQNWATLGTGVVKNTTTTGALTNAAAADIYGLWSGTCSSTTLLHGAGACGAAALTTDVSGVLPIANGGTNASSAAAGQIPNSTSGSAASWTATPTLGASGTVGTIAFGNATSGTVTLGSVAGALGSVTASLPANTGTIAELNLAQTWTATQTFATVNASSLLATGLFDGQAPMAIVTASTANIGSTYNSGYYVNQNATASTAVTFTLPTPAAGKQYCVNNGNNGSAATTGTLRLSIGGASQTVDYNGTLSTSGTSGYAISGGAAGDKACVVGISSTQWELYPQSGTWSVH